MRKVLTIVITFFWFTTYGQNLRDGIEPNMSLKEWNKKAKKNSWLLPKFGYKPKTEKQKEEDKAFIEATLKNYPTNRIASDSFVCLGFKDFYKGTKIAMYHFNQAFLLDSTNANIYCGYGSVYMMMGNYDEERKQYLEGLAIDSQNTQLLSGYGMYNFIQYSNLKALKDTKAYSLLDSAIYYYTKSYLSNSKFVPALYNLSLSYLQKNDCVNARKYYNECKLVDERAISADLTRLINNCKTK